MVRPNLLGTMRRTRLVAFTLYAVFIPTQKLSHTRYRCPMSYKLSRSVYHDGVRDCRLWILDAPQSA